MMNQDLNIESARSGPPIGTMFLAVLAPFATIALLATPLAFDAIKRALGF
jgi:hypothetical protein